MDYQSKWIKQLVITTISVVFMLGCAVVFMVRCIAPPTTFYESAEDGHLVILKWHLYSGVDINGNKGRDGETALHRAATRGKLESAKFLIEKGADVNIERTYDGDTPLDLATDRGHSEIADLLREHGGKTSKELKAVKK
jgi:ankyrin repeat protein